MRAVDMCLIKGNLLIYLPRVGPRYNPLPFIPSLPNFPTFIFQ